MKPRTKLDHEVYALSLKLPQITQSQEKWAFKNCLRHIGYRTKKKVSCLDCGNIWDGPKKVSSCKCPACGSKLELIDTTKKRFSQSNEKLAIVDVRNGFQVIRHFEIWSYHKVGCKPDQHTYEIVQQWFKPNTEVTIVGRIQFMGNLSYTGDMEIRGSQRGYRGTNYYPWTTAVYPKFKCLPIYDRNGFTSKVKDIGLFDLFSKLLHDNICETLIKAKQYDLLSCRVGNRSSDVREFWSSIKIAIRNNFKIDDGITWLDYLKLMKNAGKDVKNPKCVCDKNYKLIHNKHVQKQMEIRRRQDELRAAEDAEKQRIKSEMDSSGYIKEKGIFFGLAFKSGNLSINVLESVKEFFEEGKAHGHCVFTNNYFSKKESLVFSAKVNGIPAETVEVSLTDFRILQSRGAGNRDTKDHKEIIDLVNKNMHLIKRRMKPMKVKKVQSHRIGAVA